MIDTILFLENKNVCCRSMFLHFKFFFFLTNKKTNFHILEFFEPKKKGDFKFEIKDTFIYFNLI